MEMVWYHFVDAVFTGLMLLGVILVVLHLFHVKGVAFQLDIEEEVDHVHRP